MLLLPSFLAGEGNHAADYDNLAAAFRLTSFFLHRHVYEPRGIEAASARDGFIQSALKAINASATALPPGGKLSA
jgi:DNA repair protein RecO (recombination protein O)